MWFYTIITMNHNPNRQLKKLLFSNKKLLWPFYTELPITKISNLNYTWCWWAIVCFTNTLLILCSIAYFLALWMVSCCEEESFGRTNGLMSLLAPGPSSKVPDWSAWGPPIVPLKSRNEIIKVRNISDVPFPPEKNYIKQAKNIQVG